MSNFSPSNLPATFGLESDEPNPRKLSGLLEIAQTYLEDKRDLQELSGHFLIMKNRLVAMQRDVQNRLNSPALKVDEVSRGIINSNLSNLESVELALEMFMEAATQGNLETCWDVLEELEGAANELHESSLALSDFLSDSPLVCTHCASVGEEHICPDCDAERLKVSSAPPSVEGRAGEVSSVIAQVFEAYSAVLQGKGSFLDLIDCISAAKDEVLEIEEFARPFFDDSEPCVVRKTEELIARLTEVFHGLEQMESAYETRSTSTLKSAWKRVFEQSASALVLEAQIRTT